MDAQDESVESTTYRAHLHWVILFIPFITCMVGLVILAIGMRFDRDLIRWAGYVVIIVGLIQVLNAVISYYAWKYEVTTRRVRIQTGILAIRSIDMLLTKVESVQIDMPMLGRMMGFGTLVVIGSGGTRERFAYIDEPELFRQAVYMELEQIRP